MKPSRENVFRAMAQVEQALPESGMTSVFISDKADGRRLHATQYVVRVSGDTVFVRFSRLPFVRPYVYSRQALKSARPSCDKIIRSNA